MRTFLTVALGLLLTLALTAQTRPPQVPLGAAAIQIDARPAGGQAAPLGQSQVPAIQLDPTSPETKARPFDLNNLEGVQLKTLLSAIAQQAGLTLSMPDALDKKISVNMQDATLEEVLTILVTEDRLRYEIDGKILRVFKPRMVDERLEFVYINATRSQSTSLGASASAGFSGGGIGGLGGGGVSGGSSSSISSNETTDLPKEIEGMVQKLGSGDPGASIQYNRMLGQYWVTDYPENIARMKNFLDQMRSIAGLQVYIEANLVEVQLNSSSQSGVNWRTVLGNTASFTSSLAQDSAFSAVFSVKGFDLIVSGLKTYGKVNVLSMPAVSTLNGQPALVRVGTQDVFFITQTQTDPRTGQIIQTAETPATVNEGVVLDVTPTVQGDGTVFLRLHPTITERTGQATSQRGNSAPILDVRETDTAVRVPSGSTIVIAGLISDKNLGSSTKTALSGIPILGRLFQRRTDENRKTDLVVMLTPHIFDLSKIPEMTRARQDHLDATRRELELQDNKKK